MLGGTVRTVRDNVDIVWRLTIVPLQTVFVLVAAWTDTQELLVMVRFSIQNKHEAES